MEVQYTMAKRKSKSRFPGSIYVPKGRKHLRVKVKNPDWKKGDTPSTRYIILATGLQDTPTGWKHAEELLERFWLQRKGLVPPPPEEQSNRQLTFQQLWDKYVTVRNNQIAPQSLKVIKNSFNAIITQRQKIFNKANCLEFIHEFIASNTLAKCTVNNYLVHFKQVINWASRNDIWQENLDISEYYYTLDEKPVSYFTRDECLNLFLYFWNNRGKLKWVNRSQEFALMLEIMWSTGARIGDVLSLTWAQVDFENRVIAWKNKRSKKPEVVPTSPKAMQALALVKALTPNRDKVFRWSISGRSTLRLWLFSAFEALDIAPRNRSFHCFRKTFCKKVFETLKLPIHQSLVLVRHKTVDVTVRHYLPKEHAPIHAAISNFH